MTISKPPACKRVTRKNTSVLLFAALSLGCFILAVILLYVMINNAEILTRLGFIGKMYYLILLPIGLCVAGFLFGVLRSYATWKGNVFQGALDIGGSIVGFLLVILIGLFYVESPVPFSMGVYLHGPNGKQDRLDNLSATLSLDIGKDRRQATVGEQGSVIFTEIPFNFRGKKAWPSLQSDFYELLEPGQQLTLQQTATYLGVQPKLFLLTGQVLNSGQQPVGGATVRFLNQTMVTNPDGSFHFSLRPVSVRQTSGRLTVQAGGYSFWSEDAIMGGNPVTVLLKELP